MSEPAAIFLDITVFQSERMKGSYKSGYFKFYKNDVLYSTLKIHEIRQKVGVELVGLAHEFKIYYGTDMYLLTPKTNPIVEKFGKDLKICYQYYYGEHDESPIEFSLIVHDFR
jgi:hypothetical protein